MTNGMTGSPFACRRDASRLEPLGVAREAPVDRGPVEAEVGK
jgi:hypothetical protein